MKVINFHPFDAMKRRRMETVGKWKKFELA
jgi:hypothetical protein